MACNHLVHLFLDKIAKKELSLPQSAHKRKILNDSMDSLFAEHRTRVEQQQLKVAQEEGF